MSIDICIGGDLFLRETFNGNGRSCATCHPVANNFTIDPDFIATLPPTDPLFIAENNKTLQDLEKSAQMREFSLILENVDGFGAPGGPPTPTTRFVLRTVPHNLSMGVTVARQSTDTNLPVERTGWSGDGAPGDGALKQFQQGAITQHYPKTLNRVAGTDFRLATESELVRIELFMRQLGRTNDLTLANVALTDAGAEAGRVRFLAVGCNGCHGNAGANTAGDGNRNFNTGVERGRNTALANFAKDGGLGQIDAAPTPIDPADGFGNNTFNSTPLIEAADTGPFFHTATTITGADAHNTAVATTIEEAVAFYDTQAFNLGRPAPINLTAVEIDNIARFLRVVNASFNLHLAIKRATAARMLRDKHINSFLSIQYEMLRLANVEAYDALEVLYGQAGLNDAARYSLQCAIDLIDAARTTSDSVLRRQYIVDALVHLTDANTALGTGLTFQIGDGTNMF